MKKIILLIAISILSALNSGCAVITYKVIKEVAITEHICTDEKNCIEKNVS